MILIRKNENSIYADDKMLEMPGVAKENIKIQAYHDKVEVTSNDPQREYHEVVNILPEADIETVKSTFQ